MFFDILSMALIFFSVYGLAAMSGLMAERSGTINLAINGGMIIGALTYYLTAKMMLNVDPNQPVWLREQLSVGIVIVSMMAAMFGSILITSLLSIGAINLKGDQIVIGTAINILAPVISLIVILSQFDQGGVISNTAGTYGVMSTIAAESSMDPWMTSMMLAIAVLGVILMLWFILNKTRLGLRMRAAGGNPNALAATGVSIYRVRHIGMLFSGALAGLAGAVMAAFAPSMSSFESNVQGAGFIALAILIMGQWRSHWIIVGGLAYSFLFAYMERQGALLGQNKPLLQIIPYASTVLILPLVSRFSKAPAAAGKVYDKSLR